MSSGESGSVPAVGVDGGDPAGADGIWSLLDQGLRHHGERTALRHRAGWGWEAMTHRRLAELVERFGARLREHGLGHGDRLALMGDSSLDWIVADLAALRIGAVVVPIYPTSSVDQVVHIVRTTAPALGVADSPQRLALLRDAGVGSVIVDPTSAPRSASTAAGPPVAAAAGDRPVRAADIATIVFTSGTTGEPKGCVLTHRNVHSGAANVAAALPEIFTPADGTPCRTVIALPLAHMYGRSTLLATLLAGGEAAVVRQPGEMFEAMCHQSPTFLALTPYLLDKLHRTVQEYERAGGDGAARAMGALAYVICGGASLAPEHQESFRRRGITVLGAYGMTESAAAAAINRAADNRLGTVGRPNPGTSVVVDDAGELIITGDNVSPGYWGEVDLDSCGSGPFSVNTGDLGVVDDDGFIRITGRRKDILVTSAGKNVAPTPLEDRLRVDPLITQCVVVGDQRPYVSALIAVDAAEAARLRLSRADIEARLQRAVDAANASVSRAESIRRWRLVPDEFSVAAGHLTSSGKLVRARVLLDLADEVDALYR
ncbi:long-chain fatty acid--CoA ligase [Frankia sp. AgB32]|uniref:AMP-dependent synthetase/ligase n=1 Tax=Frankia sp. AgB32 TaxID=631119 RepID=UPI00200D38C0|nr:AMP-binding protein [Frankia sp. AgB32]MCK9897344.1 AMP-binding protein [Frankia sp. AgB32]